MLGLPSSTELNRRIAKEKLYANANLSPQLRGLLKDQIEAVVWRNKLAAGTFNVSAGDTVDELQVFEIQLRQRGLDKKVLPVIAKAIPYKILFILTFCNEAQLWIETAGTFYNTDWKPLDELTLDFRGLNLDAVYESLARQVAQGRLDTSENITDAVNRDKQRQKLEREIAALEKKVVNEKQFNRQVELNTELKRMKTELEELCYA